MPGLAEVVARLLASPKAALPDLLAGWLDAAGPSERYALLKLVTGGLRAGISGRLARRALAAWGKLDPAEVEEVWHGLTPPYLPLFAWAEGRAPRPDPAGVPLFRAPMLAHPILPADCRARSPGVPGGVEVGRDPGATGRNTGRATGVLARGRRRVGGVPGDRRGARFPCGAGRGTAGPACSAGFGRGAAVAPFAGCSSG